MDINELTNDATGVGILDQEVGKVLRNTYLLPVSYTHLRAHETLR